MDVEERVAAVDRSICHVGLPESLCHPKFQCFLGSFVVIPVLFSQIPHVYSYPIKSDRKD